MKASNKYRDMSLEDLQAEQEILAEQLFKLRFQKATGQLENVTRVSQIRKDLARVKTFLTQRGKKS